RGSEDYSLPTGIARDFLQDRQKELIIFNSSLSAQLEMSKQISNLPPNDVKFKPENERLLRELDFSRFGELGPIVKATIMGRIAAGNFEESSAVYSKYIESIETELDSSLA